MIDYEGDLRGSLRNGHFVVPDVWEGFPGQAFGGFIAGAVVFAAAAAAEHPRPLSVFARYFRPVPVGSPVALELRSERRGRLVEVLSAELRNGERTLAHFSLTFGRQSEAPLESQAIPPNPPMRSPHAIAEELEAAGLDAPPLMRRTRFRGEPEDSGFAMRREGPWHLRSQWPGASSEDPAVRAAVACMPIDNFVAPAAILANGVNINAPWPVMMPSVDLAAWFYAPEAPQADADEECPAGWLSSRTSVPVCHAGFAVGRTQVWSGERLVAEGMSQVALLPPPPEDTNP